MAARAELSRLPTGSRVLDAACGIGIDALVLHRKGFRVTATDASPAMVDLARRRFTAATADIDCQVLGWTELADTGPDRFDAVLCTGNSLAHLVDDTEIEAALAGLRAVLRPGGVLLVDGHEWDVVRSRGSRPGQTEPVTRDGTTATCRYRWRVPQERDHPHDLEIDITITDPGHREICRTHVVALRPFTREQLRVWLRSAGFPAARLELDPSGDRYTAIARAD